MFIGFIGLIGFIGFRVDRPDQLLEDPQWSFGRDSVSVPCRDFF